MLGRRAAAPTRVSSRSTASSRRM